MKILGNAAIFVLIYIVFMIPTYLLPYLGSNSSIVNTAGVATGSGINPAAWAHVASMLILVVITWFRGSLVDKKWLIVFPILAMAFDFLPGLSFIPFIPTVLHIVAIVMGVSARPSGSPA